MTCPNCQGTTTTYCPNCSDVTGTNIVNPTKTWRELREAVEKLEVETFTIHDHTSGKYQRREKHLIDKEKVLSLLDNSERGDERINYD